MKKAVFRIVVTAVKKVAKKVANDISANGSGQNYIEELKGLNELLEAGIISKSEFERKKKEILKK